MNFQLDTNVWFGNWESPLELKDKAKTIINVAHHFSKRRLRNVYWQNLQELPWDIYYVRMAKKDWDTVDAIYFISLVKSIEIGIALNKLPILCHCQMGGHRGPTAGVCAAWILNGKTNEALDYFTNKATQLRPSYAKCVETPYRKSMMEMMRKYSTDPAIFS